MYMYNVLLYVCTCTSTCIVCTGTCIICMYMYTVTVYSPRGLTCTCTCTCACVPVMYLGLHVQLLASQCLQKRLFFDEKSVN